MYEIQFKNGRDWVPFGDGMGMPIRASRDEAIAYVTEWRKGRFQKFRIRRVS